MFGFSEVLAGVFCSIFVYFSVSTILLDGILSILTDFDNGSTQNSDLSDVTNLDQIPTVECWRRGGDPDLRSDTKWCYTPLKVVGRVRDRL